jgi:hypothetical protein
MPYALPDDFSPAQLAWKIEGHYELVITYIQRLFDQVEALEQTVNR